MYVHCKITTICYTRYLFILDRFTSIETIAVIGPDTSEIAKSVTEFTGLFEVPVISPAATSTTLSDRDRYKYFLRTVPSDTYQVEMIIRILHHFHWGYVILIVSDDNYGRSARRAFKKQVENSPRPICIVIDEIINASNRKNTLLKIQNENKSKVIVVISNVNEATRLAELTLEYRLFWLYLDCFRCLD